MRVIIEISIPMAFGGKRLWTARKLNDITDWQIVHVRDIPFQNVTVYTIQAEVSPNQLRDLRDAGYDIQDLR